MFSSSTLTLSVALVLAIAARPVSAGIKADCWATWDCDAGGRWGNWRERIVLNRNNGCTLPDQSWYDNIPANPPPAWVMGEPPHFCGNRKSLNVADPDAGLAEAMDYCWQIGAKSACKWEESQCICVTKPKTYGDPHVSTWAGEDYDFHGECDLVFLDAPELNTTIHIRTTHVLDWSFIEAASIRVNDDILEVASWGEYLINGVDKPEDLPETLGGLKFEMDVPNKKTTFFTLHYGNGQYIKFKAYKRFVAVFVQMEHEGPVATSVGLMGSPVTGKKIGRDGATWMYDNDALGQEWQVRPDVDPQLFEAVREPVYPQQKCRMPSKEAKERRHRRLGESMAREQAEQACARWGMNKEQCIYDVMVTGDLDMAEAGDAF